MTPKPHSEVSKRKHVSTQRAAQRKSLDHNSSEPETPKYQQIKGYMTHGVFTGLKSTQRQRTNWHLQQHKGISKVMPGQRIQIQKSIYMSYNSIYMKF